MGTLCSRSMEVVRSCTLALVLIVVLIAAPARAVDDPVASDLPGTLLEQFSPSSTGDNYNYVGGAHFSTQSQEFELTTNAENSVGAIWSKEVNHADGWEMQFLVHVSGEPESTGKGLAFWYTNQPLEVGTLYGSDERFEGFGLLFDSHDDDGKNDNPIIMGFVNDGTKVFNHDTDGLGTRFGGCRAKYRNRGNKVGVKITYSQDSIKVLLDMRNNGVWERCLAKDSIYLATGSHIGFSASLELHLALVHFIGHLSEDSRFRFSHLLNSSMHTLLPLVYKRDQPGDTTLHFLTNLIRASVQFIVPLRYRAQIAVCGLHHLINAVGFLLDPFLYLRTGPLKQSPWMPGVLAVNEAMCAAHFIARGAHMSDALALVFGAQSKPFH